MELPKIVEGKDVSFSRFFPVSELTIAFDGGREEIYHIARFPDVVMVLAMSRNGEVLMTNQWKPGKWVAQNRLSLELPAGTINPGETPLQAAKRELKEETGLEVGEKDLVEVYAIQGNSAKDTMIVHGFLVKKPLDIDLFSLQQDLDPTEVIGTTLIPIRKALDAIGSGEIGELATAALLSQAALKYPRILGL